MYPEFPMPRITLQMGWHRLCWCGSAQKVEYVRSSSGSCKNENVMNMINQYSPLVFGATRFRSDPCRVLSTIPVGMIENDGDVSTSVSPDCYWNMFSHFWCKGFNLDTYPSASFGQVWSKHDCHDSTKLHSHPARDLKHVQTCPSQQQLFKASNQK